MRRSSISPKHRHLSYEDNYLCPICRHGQITSLVLMDAFSCNFCHHIFTANLREQTLQVADSSQSLVWRWTGQAWQPLHQGSTDLTWLVWGVGMILVTLPAGIVGIASYLFPPLDQKTLSFPLIWAGLTFLVHFILVAWLLAEHHQFPAYVTLKVKLRQSLERRSR